MKTLELQPAERLAGTEEYYFSAKLKEIRQMNQSGLPVINLGIGSPDRSPDKAVIRELIEQASHESNHSYQPYQGIPELRKAFATWYQDHYGVTLDADREILPLTGSKEGLMHIAMAFINPGDEVLTPNPGYPAYQAVTRIAGGICRHYQLEEQNEWLPDLERLGSEDLSRVKLMWVNYPHMPTGSRATPGFMAELVAFAHQHGILLVNDNPYSFILNENPVSLMSVEGAFSVALELNSLSKSHNMAGWRIGMVAGRAEWLDHILRFKSQMDSGIFRPLQLAAVKALQSSRDWYTGVNEVYRQRRERVFELLEILGCSWQPSQQGMFVWARIPGHESSGGKFSDRILYDNRVFITPGFIFGSGGERYIRASLCQPAEVVDEAISRIRSGK